MEKGRKKLANVMPLHPGDERGNSNKQRCPLLSPKKDTRNLSWIPKDPAGPREEFTELIARNLKSEGFDEISSRIIGVLFIEPEEMSLEEISIETGYSLSAVSTAMKNLSQYHMVRRFQKPGSKKAFFFLDKDLVSIGAQALRIKYDNVILPSKRILPHIIEEYEQENSEKTRTELEIVSRYYRQILKLESLVGDFLDEMENMLLEED